MISIVSCGSLEPAWGGLVSDSHGKGEDARHGHPVPRAGGVELVRHHALHELLAVRFVPNGRVDLHPRDAPVGRHPEANAVGAAGDGASAKKFPAGRSPPPPADPVPSCARRAALCHNRAPTIAAWTTSDTSAPGARRRRVTGRDRRGSAGRGSGGSSTGIDTPYKKAGTPPRRPCRPLVVAR